jgi:hypothetical protein
MDRQEFLRNAVRLGFGSSALLALNLGAASASAPPEEKFEALKAERDFIVNWLTDLLAAIDSRLDPASKVLLMAGCGQGCFDRHQFKKDIARQGHGDLDRLTAAYSKNFEVWRDGNLFHIRYGKTSKGCYCPVARNLLPKPNDMHCECTRATHQAVFEAALERPFKVEIAESLRRGGVTCHFIVHLD